MSFLDTQNDSKYANVLEMSPYAYSKYLAESYALKSSLSHVSSVRFSTLFYKDPNKDGLSKLIYDAVTTKKITLYNNGEAERNFIPLSIAAQYVKKICQDKPSKKQIFNVAAPEATSFKDIANILQEFIPDLTIENKELPSTAPVLSQFSTQSIEVLGKINFSLKEEIFDYIKELQK